MPEQKSPSPALTREELAAIILTSLCDPLRASSDHTGYGPAEHKEPLRYYSAEVWNRALAKADAILARLSPLPAEGWVVVPATEETIRYVARYGGSCRGCADEDGICPGDGLPCENPDKAIRHVLDAVSYGVRNGYLSAIPSPEKGPAQSSEEQPLGCVGEAELSTLPGIPNEHREAAQREMAERWPP